MTTTNEAIATLCLHENAEIRALGETIKAAAERRKRGLDILQEALSQLRLDMKYLVFDLEATRRERDSARAEASAEGVLMKLVDRLNEMVKAESPENVDTRIFSAVIRPDGSVMFGAGLRGVRTYDSIQEFVGRCRLG